MELIKRAIPPQKPIVGGGEAIVAVLSFHEGTGSLRLFIQALKWPLAPAAAILILYFGFADQVVYARNFKLPLPLRLKIVLARRPNSKHLPSSGWTSDRTGTLRFSRPASRRNIIVGVAFSPVRCLLE